MVTGYSVDLEAGRTGGAEYSRVYCRELHGVGGLISYFR